jgi:hypothetical protein
MTTARDYRGICKVRAYCADCDKARTVNLAALIAAGQGYTPLTQLPLQCQECGRIGQRIIVDGEPKPRRAHRSKN